MGGAIAGGRPWPTPGVAGNGLGTNASIAAAAPAQQPNLQKMPVLNPTQPLTPATVGRSLQPGQAALPWGQSPMNPWGLGRGGSGKLPISYRPGTLPGTRNY